MKQGLVQVYTGNGKGKTTAAVGQGIRALGQGLKVCMVQFLKTSPTGELTVLKGLEPGFTVYRFESPRGFFWTLNDEQKKELTAEIRTALDFVWELIRTSACDVLILDEIMGALGNELVDTEEVLRLIAQKPSDMELILTGRHAPPEVEAAAHYVSEICEIKHPAQNGINGRRGIEY